jgi:hypothetical protein
MNSRGVAGVLVASLLLSVLASVYVLYQVNGVPGYCKNAERKMLEDFLSGIRELATKQRNVIGSGTPSGVTLETQYAYPSIPFFLTPSYASASYSTYDITATIANIASDELQIPSSVILKGKALAATFNPVFSTPVSVFLELGIITTDGAYIDGSIMGSGEIFLPFFNGTPSMQLYPESAGGRGVVIKPMDPVKNITITISGSKIPERAWKEYGRATGFAVKYDRNNRTATIEIPPNSYVLRSGISSFISGSAANPPTYLKPLTPTVQKSPGVVVVQAIDSYFNPARGNIELRLAQGSRDCTVLVPTPSGLSQIALSDSDSYTVTSHELSVLIDVRSGTSVFVSKIQRAEGGIYEVAFAVTK